MTNQEYWKEVKELAETLIDEAEGDTVEEKRDDIFDSRLHETIDGHEWVIYYAYHLDILKYTDNAEYMSDNFGGEALEHAVKEGGVDMLHAALAFWALYADVAEEVYNLLDEMEG